MKKRIYWPIIVWMALTTTAQADWSRDITYQTGEPSGEFAYLGIQGIHDGPVVADVVPAWSGNEVLQATRTSIWIMSADNQQTPLVLALPTPRVHVDCPFSADGDEFIAGQPAVGDVDNDGDNDIVVGITYKCEEDNPGNEEWYMYYYGSVVWWTWNGTSFVSHLLRLEDAGVAPAFLGTPAICRTEWTNGGSTVVFWGPGSIQDTPTGHSSYYLTAFDLSNPQLPGARQATESETGTAALVTWALGSGIYVQAADLTGDGYDELIAHNNKLVYRFDWNAEFSFFSHTNLYTVPTVPEVNAFQSGHGAIADVDADGDLEYLVSYATTATPPQQPTNGRLVQIDLSGVGQPIYGTSEPNTYPIVGSLPGACDLSTYPQQEQFPEGRLSPITSTRRDSRLYNSVTGALRSFGWPNVQRYYPNDQRNVSNPALAYVTSLPVQPQFIKVDIGLPNEGDNEIRVYDAITGNVVHTEDLTVPSLYLDPDGYSAVTSSPVYSDLDGNGQGSIITSFRTGQNTLRIFRTDPGFAFNSELAEWQQVGNGPKHTGLYAQPVTGTQPRTSMVWEGRITVHDGYVVDAGKTLTIKPGTVVEFRPNAYMVVLGSLYAEGTQYDSIYFKADGTSPWDAIYIANAQDAVMEYCVIHGGTYVYIEGPGNVALRYSRIYDMFVGLEVIKCARTNFYCQQNLIHDCAWYGIRGTLSAGSFSSNKIYDCGRAGIYWLDDDPVTAQAPVFAENYVFNNALGPDPICGAYFDGTNAQLKCNVIYDNGLNQIICNNAANIVMNNNGESAAANYVSAEDNIVECTCTPPCNCSWGQNFIPLTVFSASYPALVNGRNTFRYEGDGTFMWTSCPMLTFNVSNNYWERNGTAHPGPNLGDAHFCPPWMFTSTGTAQTECLTPLESTGPGSEAAYFEAASLESGEDIESAHSAFANIIETYPESPEAIWSTRGLLRTGLAHGISAIQNHDSLLDNYNNESLSEQVRQAARREAVWALIAGGRFADARTELSAIEFDPNAGEDSVWAVVTTEVVNLLDVGAGAYRVGAQASGMSKRITDFHNRLHQIMGRAEDSVIESEAVTPQSHLIATAYPNPFNNSVTIQLQLTEAGPLKLRIFNLLGQEVEMLADKPFEAGTHRFDWNGASSPSGVYFYRVEQNGHIQSHKLMLLK